MTVTKILLLNSLYLREVNDNINNLKCEGVRGNGKEFLCPQSKLMPA